MFKFSEFRKAALEKKYGARAIPMQGGARGYREEDIDAHREACKKVDWNAMHIASDKRRPFAVAG